MCQWDVHGFVTYRCPQDLCPECTFKWSPTTNGKLSRLRRIKICKGCRNVPRDCRMTMRVMPVNDPPRTPWDAPGRQWKAIQ